MKRKLSSLAAPALAFTLIELLVGMTVLALLTLMVIQIVGLSSNAMEGSSKRQDSVAAARFSLDRIGADLTARLRRNDVGLRLEKKNGSDSLAFYAEVSGYGGNRQLAAVGYRTTDSGGEWRLERGVTGGGWTEDLFGAGPAVAEADFATLAESVFRMETSFLNQNGELTAAPPPDLSQLGAVVIAVAALDGKTRRLLPSDALSDLANRLPDAVDGEEPLTTWRKAVETSDFGPQLPPAVMQNVKFFQRTFYVR